MVLLLIVLACPTDDCQCATGPLEDTNVPVITPNNQSLLPGSFLLLEFRRDGLIAGFSGQASLNNCSSLGSHSNCCWYSNYSTLVLYLKVWRQNLSHYFPTETKWSVTLSPQIIHPKMELCSYSFSSNLDGAPIEVESGDVLGIYLVQNTLNISIESLTEL